MLMKVIQFENVEEIVIYFEKKPIIEISNEFSGNKVRFSLSSRNFYLEAINQVMLMLRFFLLKWPLIATGCLKEHFPIWPKSPIQECM